MAGFYLQDLTGKLSLLHYIGFMTWDSKCPLILESFSFISMAFLLSGLVQKPLSDNLNPHRTTSWSSKSGVA